MRRRRHADLGAPGEAGGARMLLEPPVLPEKSAGHRGRNDQHVEQGTAKHRARDDGGGDRRPGEGAAGARNRQPDHGGEGRRQQAVAQAVGVAEAGRLLMVRDRPLAAPTRQVAGMERQADPFEGEAERQRHGDEADGQDGPRQERA